MKMPHFFISHGSPMNAIEDNLFTRDWQTLHQGCPTPSAIVVFSAHWFVPGCYYSANTRLKTLHDFGGFPEALFQQQYPAPTALNTAEKIQQLMHNSGFEISANKSWGLDHGSWSVLSKLYPSADIPVLQISLNSNETDLHQHYLWAKSLRSLRDEGILFIGSGGIVHNIGKWMRSHEHDNFDWASHFDEAIAQALSENDLNTLFNYQHLPYAQDAVPTLEHYLPLIYNVGLKEEEDDLRFSAFDERSLANSCSRSIRFG